MSALAKLGEKVATLEGQANLVAGHLPKDKSELNQKLRDHPGLFIRSGKLKGEGFLVEELPFRIGRGPNNHLQLPDPQVEPYHAEITKNAEGQYLISGVKEGATPLYFRQRRRYKPKTFIVLENKQYIQLGHSGVRIQFKYLGRTIAPPKAPDPNVQVQPVELTDLGPGDLLRGLTHLLAVARLNQQERLVIDEAARAIKRLKWFRISLILLTIALGAAVTTAVFFQGRYTDKRSESDKNQASWSGAWSRMFIEGEELASVADVVAPEVALDPVTGQIMEVMRSFDQDKFKVEPLFLRRVKQEIDVEVRRIRNADLDPFLERYGRFHPQIAAIMERTYNLPRNFAYLAWVLSDYRLDLRDEKALGLWQFRPSTAERYGLIVNGGDYRQDFGESTRAAGEFLVDLVTLFSKDHFLLVAGAFQGGEGRVLQAFEQGRLWRMDMRTYERLCPLGVPYGEGLLPEETCRFPMRFLAATIIGEFRDFHLRRE